MKNINKVLVSVLAICLLFTANGCSNDAPLTNDKNRYKLNLFDRNDMTVEDYFDFNNLYSDNQNANNNSNGNSNNGSTDDTSGDFTDDGSTAIKKVEYIPDTAPLVKWETNKLSAPGDEFVLPNIKQATGAPILAQLSKQVSPGSSVTIMGEGLSDATTKLYYITNNNTKKIAKTLIANDTQAEVTIDSSEEYGVYGIYAENNKGTSAIKLVNVPKIWWSSFTDVNAGDVFNLYGENLSTKNGNTTNVYLIDNEKHYKMEVVFADPYKVSVVIPKGLENEKTYKIKLHNGHGGEYAWAVYDGLITYSIYKVNDNSGKVINVVDYGAKPDDKDNDDSLAIAKAITAAGFYDTIYFPKGTYVMKSGVAVDKPLSLVGENADTTKIITHNKAKGTKGALFNCLAGPTEFSELSFEDIRKDRFDLNFIYFKGNTNLNGSYNLYVHDCKFYQLTEPKQLSLRAAIKVQGSTNILVKNNYCETTQVLSVDGVKRMIITDNEVCGTNYVGAYYHQNQFLIWNADMFDCSNNKIYGKDLLTDKTGEFQIGDFTAGRSFALQFTCSNGYISHNNIERTGLPRDNAGEQILIENANCLYRGGVTDATKNTIKLSDTVSGSFGKMHTIIVTKGKGVGQYRKLKLSKGANITLSEEWDIIPDDTSYVMIVQGFPNLAIHKNKIDGFKNHYDAFGSTTGIQAYGNLINCFMTENEFKNMPFAVCITPHYEMYGSEKATSGIYWIQCDNNKISDVCVGVYYMVENMKASSGEIPMYLSFGNTFRGNAFNNIFDFDFADRKGLGGNGIVIGSPHNRTWAFPINTWNGGWVQATLIENNVFNDCANHNIVMCKHQDNTVLRGNTATGNITNIYDSESGIGFTVSPPKIYN